MKRWSHNPRSNRALVAIVESDDEVTHAVSRLLDAAGYKTCTSKSGESLLASAIVHLVDCFVLDVHLPDMSAFDLHDRLRSVGAAAPVVLITARDRPKYRRAARDVRMFAYLPMPFCSTSLVNVVQLAIASTHS